MEANTVLMMNGTGSWHLKRSTATTGTIGTDDTESADDPEGAKQTTLQFQLIGLRVPQRCALMFNIGD